VTSYKRTDTSSDLNASAVGINLQLFGQHLFTQLVYRLLCFFQLPRQLDVLAFQPINRLLHVRLLSGFLCKDLLVTLQITLALHNKKFSATHHPIS